jgi:hypothetical protein
MTASSTTRIAQADLYPTAPEVLTALDKRIGPPCRHYRLRSSTRAKALPRVGFAAGIRKDRSNPDHTACAPLFAPVGVVLVAQAFLPALRDEGAAASTEGPVPLAGTSRRRMTRAMASNPRHCWSSAQPHPARTRSAMENLKMVSKAQNLIYGTAIKARVNSLFFSDLQISNRR